jgi:outer membrane protein OmpA-like peptidoglycan-associated protein
MKKFIFCILALLATGILSAQTLQPTETEALLDIMVVGDNNKPREGEEISFTGIRSKKVFKGVTGADGKFSLLVPEGDKYVIRYKSFTDSEDYDSLDIPSLPGMIHQRLNVTIEPPKVFTLKNVLFDTGKATLKPESFPSLNELASFMKLKKTLVIEVAGHTDDVGDPAANMKLSQQRAETVRTYLIQKGVPADRITAKGYGDTEPVADNSTAEGKKQNRRTEVRVIKE